MAELLIRNRDSHLDHVSQEIKDTWDDKMWAKYNRRRQKGDIVEVQEDGYYLKHGWDKKVFAIVLLKGYTKDDVLYLMRPLIKNEVFLKERRYNVGLDFSIIKTVTKTNINEIMLTDKDV